MMNFLKRLINNFSTILVFFTTITLLQSLSIAQVNVQEHNFNDPSDSLVFLDSTNINQNIWTIGIPKYKYLLTDSGNCNFSAIYTDSAYYRSKNTSSFYVKYINHIPWYGIYFFIRFKMDCDSMKDFGEIYVKSTNGQWMNMIKEYRNIGKYKMYKNSSILYFDSDTCTYTDNYYNPFTGLLNDKNELYETYDLVYYMSTWHNYWPQTVIFRFDFFSDSLIDQREGWLIDYISIDSYLDLEIDSNSSDTYNVYPNPFKDFLNLKLSDSEKNNELVFNLYSINGILLQSVVLKGDTKIDLNYLSAGVYYYTLIENNLVIKSDKIIKIK